MRIAIFSDNFYPEISGISDSIISLANELAKRGHKINFYVPYYTKNNFITAKLDPKEIKLHDNIKIFRLISMSYPMAPTKQGRFVFPILSSFWHIKKFNPDIIYTQDFFSAGLEALMLSRILKVPLIGTNHTPITEFLKYAPIRAKWINRFALSYVSWYYNKCLWVSAPSQSILDEMKKNGLKKNSQAVSNPIDLSSFSPVCANTKKQLKKKFGFSNRVIFYAGRLAQEKNIDVIIRAVALVKEKFSDITFAITGYGSAKEELEKLTKELGLEKNIIFFGYVEMDVFSELYSAADIFTVMSTAETQCISMLQAMAAGIPVIGANAWGLPEYIDERNGFVIEPGDVNALAKKIIELLEDDKKRFELGQGGVEKVKKFSIEMIVNHWEDIFQKEFQKKFSKLKLSFVIPAYNEENYLGDCLRSIFQELEKEKINAEVIVVNNASTDRTRDVAKSFPRAIIVDEPKKGLVMARCAGYLASSGDLVANLDADTRLCEGWLNKVFAEFSVNPKLVALSGPFIYYDLSKTIRFFVYLWYAVGNFFHLINQYVFKNGSVLQGGNFIVRRTAMEKIGGFNSQVEFYGEDADIAKRIRAVGQVKFTLKLPIYSSGRRLSEKGLFATGWLYAINYFWVILFKKSFSSAHEDIRK